MRTHGAIYSDCCSKAVSHQDGQRLKAGRKCKAFIVGKRTASGMPPVEAVGIGELQAT